MSPTAASSARGFMNARYRNGLAQGQGPRARQATDATVELIDKDHVFSEDQRGAAHRVVEQHLGLSDESRATNTIDLAASTLELPTDGPEPAAAASWPATAPAPAAPPAAAPTPCRKKVTIERARRPRQEARRPVDGRRMRARVRGAAGSRCACRRGRAVIQGQRPAGEARPPGAGAVARARSVASRPAFAQSSWPPRG